MIIMIDYTDGHIFVSGSTSLSVFCIDLVVCKTNLLEMSCWLMNFLANGFIACSPLYEDQCQNSFHVCSACCYFVIVP